MTVPPTPPAELVAYLEGLPEPHILLDGQYRIAAANAAYRQRFDAHAVGRTCHAVSHGSDLPCDQAGETCPLAAARASGRRERVLHRHHTPQGAAHVSIELVPVRGRRGVPEWYVEKMEPLAPSDASPAAPALIGRAPAFRALMAMVARVGPSEASVLLLGESGTGKELVARAVHEASPRAGRPLVVVDCASLAESLFESELFGHEKGAFTGAHAARPGLVEAADGGTLFLDEVGDIPPAIQVKLLRLLESGSFRRVGSTELRRADLRVVAATHRDLRALIAQGRFREDLYHRLATVPIRLPALRERAEDIPLLAAALLARLAPGRRVLPTPAALARLAAAPYPGNVRELRNVLERALLFSDGPSIGVEAVAQALALDARRAAPPAARAMRPDDATLRAALATHRGDRRALAQALGLSLRTLYRRLKALDAAG